MFVSCKCCVLSGRGLCDKLITRPEKSYRLWCVIVCDLETTKILVNEEEAKAHQGAIAPRERGNFCNYHYMNSGKWVRHHGKARSQVVDGGDGLQFGGWLWISWKSGRGQPTRGGPPDWGLSEVLTTPHHKNILCYEMFTQKASGLDWYFGMT